MFKIVTRLMARILFTAIFCLNTYAYASPPPKTTETIIVAGGCFWGIQAVFQHTKGVLSALSGYAGGSEDSAHYERVSAGNTGHAESVKISYDPEQITLEQLLSIYFTIAHDPTELNYQGPDHGTQYRSAIFYHSLKQQKAVQAYMSHLTFSEPVVTKLEPLEAFYLAEDYHQNYARLHPYNPYIMMYDAPKLAALEKTFPELYVK